jgi:hypothetical protein
MNLRDKTFPASVTRGVGDTGSGYRLIYKLQAISIQLSAKPIKKNYIKSDRLVLARLVASAIIPYLRPDKN